MKIVCCVEGLGSYAGVEALLVSVRFGLLVGMMQSWKCMRIALVNGRFPTKRNYISSTHSDNWLHMYQKFYILVISISIPFISGQINKPSGPSPLLLLRSRMPVTSLFSGHYLTSPKWKTIPKDMTFIVYFGPLCTSKRLRRSKYYILGPKIAWTMEQKWLCNHQL